MHADRGEILGTFGDPLPSRSSALLSSSLLRNSTIIKWKEREREKNRKK